MIVTILKKNAWSETYASATQVVKTFNEYIEFCDSMGFYQMRSEAEFDFSTGSDAVYILPYKGVLENGN